VTDAEGARSSLEREHASLRQQMAELDINDEAGDYDDNFADTAQVAAEQGEARAIFRSLQAELADVESALQRLDAGTYGLCEKCSAPIGEARLEAMPAARYCINCAD